jgi:hypothetical protein
MLYVEGLTELRHAVAESDDKLPAAVKRGLRAGGRIVQDEAQRLFNEIDENSAAGFRTRVRGTGRVMVEQSKRKTTGAHPDYGALQMRHALIPARDEKLDDVAEKVEREVIGLLRDRGF